MNGLTRLGIPKQAGFTLIRDADRNNVDRTRFDKAVVTASSMLFQISETSCSTQPGFG